MNLETFIDRMLLLDGSEKTTVVVAIYKAGKLRDVEPVFEITNGLDRYGKTIVIIHTHLKDGKLSAGSGDHEND